MMKFVRSFAVPAALATTPALAQERAPARKPLRELDHDSETDLVSRVSAGVSVEWRRPAAGLTVRDYLGADTEIGTEQDAHTRNDLAPFASVGARF